MRMRTRSRPCQSSLLLLVLWLAMDVEVAVAKKKVDICARLCVRGACGVLACADGFSLHWCLARSPARQDYYALLGVKKNADDATLKKAYRKLGRFPPL